MKSIKFITVICAPWILISCASIGVHEVKMDMPAYGDVLMQGNSEQVLRNIVHIAYGEPQSYLKLSAISASYSFNTGISGPSGNWNIGSAGGIPNTSLVQGLNFGGAGYSFGDSPSIQYTPLDDSAFVSLMIQPVSFNNVAMLYNGEANYIGLLTKVAFSRVGRVDNASSAGTAKVEDTPTYKDYQDLIDTIAAMTKTGNAIIRVVSYADQTGLMLHFNKNAVSSPNALAIKKLLNIPAKYSDIVFLGNPTTTLIREKDGSFVTESSLFSDDDNLVFVRTRSIAGIMAFLSHAVRIPDSDLKANYAQEYIDASGKPFDWGGMLNNILIIYSSDSEPKDALTKTYVNNHWFYIKRSDANSKYTFVMLMKLMTLVTGVGQPASQSMPVLTLPVNR